MNSVSPPIELELKLEVPSGAVRRLSAHRLLKGAAPVSKQRRLHSIYFDTPRLDLWRQGIALRLRRDGGRWVQAVKGEGSALAGLHRRLEDEVDVAGPAPDFSRIGPALAGAFSSEDLRARLRPVFVTDFVRSSRILELDPETRVEASIDRGTVRSGKRSAPILELELELKSGAPQHLYEAALALVKDLPLSIENRSKAERGYALYRGKKPKPAKAQPAALVPAFSVGESFKAVMQSSIGHLQANERGMLEDADPEFLHQMRVALRRLRSAFGVFGPAMAEAGIAPLAAELKWLATSLGPARDWDVFVTETLPPIEKEFGTHGELKAFSEHCRELRRLAGARARRVVRSKRYRRLMLTLGAWLASDGWLSGLGPDQRSAFDAPISGLAAKELERRYDRARKRGRGIGRLSTKELHRLRIAIKKFRYATDFFAGLYEGKPVREALKRLSRLQDMLGAINDAGTVANLIAQGFDGAGEHRAPEAKGILLGWSRHRAATLRGELKEPWKRFRAAARFWR